MAENNSSVKGCIYQARNTINGKCYIGKTINFVKRKILHLYQARHGAGYYFHRAIHHYGEEAFEWSILFQCDDHDVLLAKEKELVDSLGTKIPNGYNITDGGRGACGLVMSEETRKKISKALTGKKHTDEQRAKNSAAKLGHKLGPFTQEHKDKIGRAHKGRKKGPLSEEHRKKLGAARKGYKHTEEVKAKIRAKNKGQRRSEEQIARMRVAQTLRAQSYVESNETRAKRSASMKQRWSDPELRTWMSIIHKGKKLGPQSPEHRAKLAAVRKGKKHGPQTPEQRAKKATSLKLYWKKKHANTNVLVVARNQKTLF